MRADLHAVASHPHAWLWEPLAELPTFELRSMFGAKAVYLEGRLQLCFTTRAEPWRGVLVATERTHHAALMADFPSLQPHPILPKWLHLAEKCEDFEQTAQSLVKLVRKLDPRIGIVPSAKKRRPKVLRSKNAKLRTGTKRKP